MNKAISVLSHLVLVLLLFVISGSLLASQVSADASWCSAIPSSRITVDPNFGETYVSGEVSSMAITVPTDNQNLPLQDYHICVFQGVNIIGESSSRTVSDTTDSISFSLDNPNFFELPPATVSNRTHTFYLYEGSGGCAVGLGRRNNRSCNLGSITLTNREYACTESVVVTQTREVEGEQRICSDSCLDTSGELTFTLEGVTNFAEDRLVNSTDDLQLALGFGNSNNLGTTSVSSPGKYTWNYTPNQSDGGNSFPITITRPGALQQFDNSRCSPPAVSINSGVCRASSCGGPSDSGNAQNATFILCNQIPADSPARSQCESCSASGNEKVWTAVGCISKDPIDIITQIITIGIGVGGGIALLMVIAGGFMLTISQGNPQKTGEAKEMITSAIIGLLFVLFSVVILQFIGVTIFHIPGFGEPPGP